MEWRKCETNMPIWLWLACPTTKYKYCTLRVSSVPFQYQPTTGMCIIAGIIMDAQHSKMVVCANVSIGSYSKQGCSSRASASVTDGICQQVFSPSLPFWCCSVVATSLSHLVLLYFDRTHDALRCPSSGIQGKWYLNKEGVTPITVRTVQ